MADTWWVPLVLAVVIPLIAWAAMEYRKPETDPEGERLVTWVHGLRVGLADDIATSRTEMD